MSKSLVSSLRSSARKQISCNGVVRLLSSTAVITAMLLAPRAFAERSAEAVIASYVAQGLHDNLALRSESLAVEQAEAALKIARAQYLPELGFSARYTRAHGGRQIDLPVGTLLNPVYSTLNSMLAAQGQPANFPQIDDEHISFLRPREQDTRITARQPIFAPGLAANVRAQHALYRASQSERVALARELKRDITVAYLNWLRANRAKDIVAASKSLLAENLRVTQAMFDNGKVTQDRVLRARAEMLNVEQQLRDAENAQTQAQSYCNFLLNRPLDTALEHGEVPSELRSPAFDLANLQHDAFDNRPELEQLARAAEAAREQTSAARSAYLPTLSLGIDAGTQGENYGFGPDYNFSTASLVLTWNIYSGGATEARVAGARAAQRQAVVQQSETAQRVALQVQQALDSYRTSVDSVATATARAEAAQAAFRIASRKRDEGALSQVEFIDARTELTNAELNLNLTRFDVLARHADLDYATANGSVPLP